VVVITSLHSFPLDLVLVWDSVHTRSYAEVENETGILQEECMARWTQDVQKLCSGDQSLEDWEMCIGEIFIVACYRCVLMSCIALNACYVQ
jgi:hypothetical protein